MGAQNPPSAVLFGANNLANGLENGILHANGQVTQYDGLLNLINYSSFENSATTGWSLGTTSVAGNGLPTGAPTFGSGANVNLSMSTTATNPLFGTTSLQLVSSAGTVVGNFAATDALTVPVGLQSTVISWNFAYNVTSGSANCNFSGSLVNSFGVAIYDVTNSAWLGVAGQFNIIQGTGTGRSTGTCQLAANTASIRFVVYFPNGTTGAVTFQCDQFYLGPQTSAQAPAMSNWVAYIPTGSWSTNTTYAGKYRRVGDSAEVQVTVSLTGAPTSAALTINLPSGLVIDTTKLTSTGGTKAIGYGSGLNAGSGFGARVVYTSTTAIAVNAITAASGSSNYDVAVDATHPGTFANADSVTVAFLVPIVGWDSNAVSSADTDTRVIAMRATGATTALTTTPATVIYPTATYDTAGAYNTSTGIFTVPVTGKYRVSAYIQTAAVVQTTTSGLVLFLFKNGSQYAQMDADVNKGTASSASVTWICTATDEVNCNAGDTLNIAASSTASVSLISTPSSFVIERLSGPAVVQATESVNMHYTNANPQAVAGASSAVITTWTKTFDSHNAFNASTGVYTVPVSGKYRVASTLGLAAVAFTVGSSRFAQYGVSGSQTSWIDLRAIWATITGTLWLSGGVTLSYNAGDTISVTLNNQTGSTLTLDSTAVDTSISIERVGN